MDKSIIRQIIQDFWERDQQVDLTAQTYLSRWHSASNPVLASCNDGRDYVIKGLNAGRMIVNDRLVGLLGMLIGAPVGQVALVQIPQELISIEPNFAHLPVGLAHGSQLIRDCGERESIMHTDVPENRRRFARLALLYGWVMCGDIQFIYENSLPHLVHSVDHGHFFPDGPDWTEASLSGATAPVFDSTLESACHFSSTEIDEAAKEFRGLSAEAVVRAVAQIPKEWRVTIQECVSLAAYLVQRQEQLRDALGLKP